MFFFQWDVFQWFFVASAFFCGITTIFDDGIFVRSRFSSQLTYRCRFEKLPRFEISECKRKLKSGEVDYIRTELFFE